MTTIYELDIENFKTAEFTNEVGGGVWNWIVTEMVPKFREEVKADGFLLEFVLTDNKAYLRITK